MIAYIGQLIHRKHTRYFFMHFCLISADINSVVARWTNSEENYKDVFQLRFSSKNASSNSFIFGIHIEKVNNKIFSEKNFISRRHSIWK